jgi:hypothetical protein
MTNIEYIEELEKDKKNLQKEIEKFQEKHKKATLKIKLMKDELLESQKYTNELETNNLTYMGHNLALMAENTELKEKPEPYKSTTCDDVIIDMLKTEIKKLRNTISERDNDYIEVKNKNQELVIENKKLNETVKLFDIERKDFRQAIEFYKNKSKSKIKSEEIQWLKDELKEKDKIIKNIQTYLNNILA